MLEISDLVQTWADDFPIISSGLQLIKVPWDFIRVEIYQNHTSICIVAQIWGNLRICANFWSLWDGKSELSWNLKLYHNQDYLELSEVERNRIRLRYAKSHVSMILLIKNPIILSDVFEQHFFNDVKFKMFNLVIRSALLSEQEIWNS